MTQKESALQDVLKRPWALNHMEQADMATIIGCSPGYVSGFVGSTANPDWGEKCNSFALELGYFAMRIDLTPTAIIWVGLSPGQLEKMPTSAEMATKSK